MIKISIQFIFILYLFTPVTVSSQNFFDLSQINKLEIYFEQTEWDSLLHEFWSDSEDERLVGSVRINGQEFDSVGVRYKGYSSYRSVSDKKPLNIKLDHILNQDYKGFETLKLSNIYRDPSFLREVLGYEIARKYMPASLANYIDVFINDEHFGLYINVETVDKAFIEKHFLENNGVFIKGAPQRSKGGYTLMGEANLEYLGPDVSRYLLPYDLKSDVGWNDLIELCDILVNDVNRLQDVFNVDRALWLLAFHNVLVSLDSPLNAPRNFYLYKDTNDKFNIMPWDLNMTFATYGLMDDTWNHTLEDYQNLDPLFNHDSEKYPLLSKMFLNSYYRRQYIAHMKTILNENFINGWYKERGIELQNLIKDYVNEDQKKVYSYPEFLANLDSTVYDGNRNLYGITELMEGRIDFLNNHPMFSATPPAISDVQHYPSEVKKNSNVIITAKLENEDLVQLGYRNGIMDKFERINMHDDGTNGDVEADDGIFSVTITSTNNDIHYFIYSDNYQASVFAPERAEYEYFTVPVESNIVINEFMASNDLAIADQDGEFDDWIELYNNTPNSIDIGGYYLSDNASNLTKWMFPDTIIGAKDYLIVWADEDEEQDGLHANFKLSASGEVLFLLDASQQIIDEITFGAQTADISLGRFPNGTGEFAFMEHSYNSINNDPLTSIEIANEIRNNFYLSQNYPNPFNPETTIKYHIPTRVNSELSIENDVTLKIFDILGREVATLVDETQRPGNYEVSFNAENLNSGVFLYRLQVNDNIQIKKMIYLK